MTEARLVAWAAESAAGLDARTDEVARSLAGDGFGDGLPVGSGRFRRAIVGHDPVEMAAAMRDRDPTRMLDGEAPATPRPVAFLLPGVGDQYVGMARGLYDGVPVFRDADERCADELWGHLRIDIRELIYPPDADPSGDDGRAGGTGVDLRAMLRRGKSGASDDRLREPGLAQPAVFVVEYALAQLWMHWGMRPTALLGYSLGEYVAAHLAGVLGFANSIELVAHRSKLVEALPKGAMLAMMLGEAAVSKRLPEGVTLAAVNSESMCVVAGTLDRIEKFEEDLAEDEVVCLRVRIARAFHSPHMWPAADELTRLVGRFQHRAPAIPYVSNVTGTWMTKADALDPEYWARHLVGPVRFADGLGALLVDSRAVLLEVGPGQTLGSLALRHPTAVERDDRVAVASLKHAYDRHDDVGYMLTALARLWLAGVAVDWRSE